MMEGVATQAVGEVAKTTGKAIEAVSDLGKYASEVFGDAPKNAVGLLVGDYLYNKRIRNAARLKADTERYLAKITQERISAPSASVVVPLLEASADEDRPVLSDLWARLLANASIDQGQRVRVAFFQTLRTMEPLDALILSLIPNLDKQLAAADKRPVLETRLRLTANVNFADFDVDVSLAALAKLDCLSAPPSHLYITPYGRAFLQACTVV